MGNPYLYYININNDMELLKEREELGINKTILTYLDFRKGISLSINRPDFVAQQGYGKPMYGLISDYFVYDVETGARYRDSEAAIETLKTFYGVDDLDEITGYDLDAARACLVSGYEQALADGVVSESDKFVFDYPTYGEYAIADVEVKNQIMAAMELNLLLKYRDCPLYSPSTAQLLSMKVNYPTYTEVFEVGFGGIRRMTYNFTDAEWEAFCAQNNYQLNYN